MDSGWIADVEKGSEEIPLFIFGRFMKGFSQSLQGVCWFQQEGVYSVINRC